MNAIFFALAIFIGWVIFDYSKYKQFKKENIYGALFIAIVAGVAWFLLDIVFALTLS
ncbi:MULTISPECIES: hypothetical protein [Bacillaceae]|uniref:hypothetical protein n=1 Tax=Bacillaceae TaxID=186817 RepID=UPI000B0386D0|nr:MULTISPECIES: hypothetical protein [Bacillaceae]UOE93620.1 hypothetical protein MM271_20935 [Alkalihalobacillus sp. LMS39]